MARPSAPSTWTALDDRKPFSEADVVPAGPIAGHRVEVWLLSGLSGLSSGFRCHRSTEAASSLWAT